MVNPASRVSASRRKPIEPKQTGHFPALPLDAGIHAQMLAQLAERLKIREVPQLVRSEAGFDDIAGGSFQAISDALKASPDDRESLQALVEHLEAYVALVEGAAQIDAHSNTVMLVRNIKSFSLPVLKQSLEKMPRQSPRPFPLSHGSHNLSRQMAQMNGMGSGFQELVEDDFEREVGRQKMRLSRAHAQDVPAIDIHADHLGQLAILVQMDRPQLSCLNGGADIDVRSLDAILAMLDRIDIPEQRESLYALVNQLQTYVAFLEGSYDHGAYSNTSEVARTINQFTLPPLEERLRLHFLQTDSDSYGALEIDMVVQQRNNSHDINKKDAEVSRKASSDSDGNVSEGREKVDLPGFEEPTSKPFQHRE